MAQRMVRFFAYTCLGIISGFFILVTLTLAWFIADRKMPVELIGQEVLTPEVRPGGKLVIRQHVRYVRNCHALVDRALFDSFTHRSILPAVVYERPPQGLGDRTITFIINVPEEFEPGPGEYRTTPAYSCNPLQRYYWPITRESNVVPFTIVPR